MGFYTAWTHNGSLRLSINALFQRIQQRLRVFQVVGVEALGEPAVDGREQFARFRGLAMVQPQLAE